jgi:hypothetical protein
MMWDPDLKLGGFSLWTLTRAHPASEDFWDGNWLVARAKVQTSGALVELEGSF